MTTDWAALAQRPLAILGPTASGKSTLALAIADLAAADGHTVELVSIDSMQVYRGMNVGTATPTAPGLAFSAGAIWLIGDSSVMP